MISLNEILIKFVCFDFVFDETESVGPPAAERTQFVTAKRILQRLYHRLSKFDRSVFLILKPISYFFGVYMAWFFYLETIGVR